MYAINNCVGYTRLCEHVHTYCTHTHTHLFIPAAKFDTCILMFSYTYMNRNRLSELKLQVL